MQSSTESAIEQAIAEYDQVMRDRHHGARDVLNQLNKLFSAVVCVPVQAVVKHAVVWSVEGQRDAACESTAERRPDADASLGPVAVFDDLLIGEVFIGELTIALERPMARAAQGESERQSGAHGGPNSGRWQAPRHRATSMRLAHRWGNKGRGAAAFSASVAFWPQAPRPTQGGP